MHQYITISSACRYFVHGWHNRMALVMVTLLAALLPQTARADWQAPGSATVLKRAQLRSGPGESFPGMTLLEPGLPLDVLREQPPYVEVQLPSGKVGWVARRLLEVSIELSPPPQEAAPVPAAAPLCAQAPRHPAPAPAQCRDESPLSFSLAHELVYLATGILAGFGLGYRWRERYYRRRLHNLRV